MTTLTKLIFYGYILVVLAVGCSGIFIARWELTTIFHVPLDTLGSEAQATLINQYRFLKSMELGCGLFALVFREEIFTVRKFTLLFLAIVCLGVAARTIAIVVDGLPHWAFIAFALYEALTALLVFVSLTQRTEAARDGRTSSPL